MIAKKEKKCVGIAICILETETTVGAFRYSKVS